MPNRRDRGERRGGPAERERLDATLVALEAHLTTTAVPPDTAQLLCTTARRVLRGQERVQLGWLLAVHGDDTCRHVPSRAIWDLVIAADGRLTYLVDLGHWGAAVACAGGVGRPAGPRQIAS